MKVDLDQILWLAKQAEEVIVNVVPLLSQILGVDKDLLLQFVKWVGTATEATINAIKTFLDFPVLFGAPGDGLTDANGNPVPDCPCPGEFTPVVLALKVQHC